jgi:hypothetical protein
VGYQENAGNIQSSIRIYKLDFNELNAQLMDFPYTVVQEKELYLVFGINNDGYSIKLTLAFGVTRSLAFNLDCLQSLTMTTESFGSYLRL